MDKFYKHSGAAPISGTAMTGLGGMLAAPVLAFVYSYASSYIPFVYANLLLAIGLGFAIGWIVATLAMLGHVRHAYLVAGLAVGCSLLGLYCAWGADFLARIPLGEGEQWLDRFEPVYLGGYIAWFYENGLWGIGRHGGAGKMDTVSGIPLAFVWLCEAGILVGLPTYTAYKMLRSRAFCDQCGSWVDEEVVQLLSPAGGHALVGHLRQGDFAKLAETDRTSSRRHFLEVDLGVCGCQALAYLSIHEITITQDKKKKESTARTLLLDKLLLEPSQVELVRQAGRPPRPPSESDSPLDFLNNI